MGAAHDRATLHRHGEETIGLFVVEIRGDSLQPVLHRDDFVLAAPVTDWAGDGLYTTRNAFGEDVVFDCTVAGTRAAPRIRLGTHLEVAGRKAYPDQLVTRAEFARIVTGKVAIVCRVQDRDLFHRFARAA